MSSSMSTHAAAVQRNDYGEDQQRRCKRAEIDRGRVEERDHEDRANVIGDGQGEQEHLDAERDAAAEQR